MAKIAGLPVRLRDVGIPRDDLPQLAAEAMEQWTGKFNPRLLTVSGALEIYEWAY